MAITGSNEWITNPPRNLAHNVSKAAIMSLAEHLSYVLRLSHISLPLFVAGRTLTGLSGGGGPKKSRMGRGRGGR